MLADNFNFIYPETLQRHMQVRGWRLMNPLVQEGLVIFKPDFYPNGHVIGLSKGGYIYSAGNTLIQYKENTYESIEDLLEKEPLAIHDFGEWVFKEEKEWVVTRTGKEYLYSFSNVHKIPKRTTYRC